MFASLSLRALPPSSLPTPSAINCFRRLVCFFVFDTIQFLVMQRHEFDVDPFLYNCSFQPLLKCGVLPFRPHQLKSFYGPSNPRARIAHTHAHYLFLACAHSLSLSHTLSLSSLTSHTTAKDSEDVDRRAKRLRDR